MEIQHDHKYKAGDRVEVGIGGIVTAVIDPPQWVGDDDGFIAFYCVVWGDSQGSLYEPKLL